MKFKKSRPVIRNNVNNITILPTQKELHGDDVSTGNTEDSLISSRTSSGTLNSEKKVTECCDEVKNGNCRHYFKVITGMLLICWGVSSLIYKPFRIFMDQRLRMTPGLPPYEWWLHPPDEVLLKVHIFNLTNSVEFLNGTDKKLNVSEIGPIIYREKLTHTNPVFNENGTLTYTAKRSAIYLPELNTINLNDKIIMPNLAVLILPTYFYDGSIITKIGVNLMMRSLKSEPIMEISIHDFLWNMTDPILNVAEKIAPRLVPTKNVGILNNIYSQFTDNVTVFVGPKFHHEYFFRIDKYDGSDNLPGKKNCPDKITNSSEGVSYSQFLTKNDTLKYWRKTLCKVAYLHYERQLDMYGVTANEYVLSRDTFDRIESNRQDCYQGVPKLPNGLIDVSSCYYNVPIAASFPHFLHGDDVIKNYVNGLQPNKEKHGSYVIVEPITGIPLQGKARSQINLVMRKFRGFNEKIQKFSDISIPLCWIEYHQVGIPWYISWLMYFVVVIVPPGQTPFSVILVIVGSILVYFGLNSLRKSRHHLTRNKVLQFEAEVFLK